jgi:lysophospholipase L1-like esterase
MRRRVRLSSLLTATVTTTVTAILAAPVLAPTTANAATRRAAEAPEYYLALGDSLSLGVQPDATGVNRPTAAGYTDKLYARARLRYPNLQLVKLGCAEETTKSMVSGGTCSYPGGRSQLQEAEAFLRAHRGAVRLVTIDVGARDLYGCITPAGADTGCLLRGLATVGLNMPPIVARLRFAAGLSTRIIGMNYYNPALASWITGAEGQDQARQSQLLAGLLNAKLAVNYGFWGMRIADVATAFRTSEWEPTVPTFLGDLPQNVFQVIANTWMFSPAPANYHPKDTGYDLITDAFTAQL